MCGAAASEACLGFAVVLEVVLAGPVPICADSPGEVYRSVGAETLLAPRSAWPGEPGEGAVLVVSGDEEALPVVDFTQPPEIDRYESWVFGVVLERLGGSFIRLPIELPVEMGDVAFARLRLLEVCLDPVDSSDLV